MARRFFILFAFQAVLLSIHAQQYTQADSAKVVELLTEAKALAPADGQPSWMLHFGRKLCGTPYVAKTLEKNSEEQLVVNLRELDCTTLVETTLALTLCAKHGKTDFADYCHYLRLIRYRDGRIGYPTRLHYFTDWILDNERMGFVAQHPSPNAPLDPTGRLPRQEHPSPFTRTQTLHVDYMTRHVGQYPMFAGHPEWVDEVREAEQALTGLQFPYIPKAEIANNETFWDAIHDGDIIAITTSKAGLDTSHIGIAVWHTDGLHLLNASQVHKKVVEEPMTLHDYMQKHPSQVGIRIVRVL